MCILNPIFHWSWAGRGAFWLSGILNARKTAFWQFLEGDWKHHDLCNLHSSIAVAFEMPELLSCPFCVWSVVKIFWPVVNGKVVLKLLASEMRRGVHVKNKVHNCTNPFWVICRLGRWKVRYSGAYLLSVPCEYIWYVYFLTTYSTK